MVEFNETEVFFTIQKLITFAKNETVLTIAVILAVLYAVFVPVDRRYLQYVDFRTPALLFDCRFVRFKALLPGVRQATIYWQVLSF